jgi:Fungal Zn(2)-Cys(6) binuclear cluster domain
MKFSGKVSTSSGTCKSVPSEHCRSLYLSLGCSSLFCRIHHVKCDELGPVCFRCKGTGRKCDGYQPHRVQFLAGIGRGLDRQLPNPSLTHNANAPEEARALQFYHERTALTTLRPFTFRVLAPFSPSSELFRSSCEAHDRYVGFD